MYYTIDSKLKGEALNKMVESIPPLINTISDIEESSDSIQDFISKIDSLPFPSTNWLTSDYLKEFEIKISPSNSFSFLISIKGFVRNLTIDKLLNI